MNKQLKDYIENDIIPLYERNDWAHQSWHVKEVIDRSLMLAKDYDVNLDMVYVIAAFHDIGCYISRDNHEEESAKIMEDDNFIQSYFEQDEIVLMKEAIIDHRGSLEYEPRSIYGKIIASADRFVTIEGILRSTHSHTLQHFPNLTWNEMVDRSYQYIKKKYGIDGYAKSSIPNPMFDEFLKSVDFYLNNYEEFENKLIDVDKFLRKTYMNGSE